MLILRIQYKKVLPRADVLMLGSSEGEGMTRTWQRWCAGVYNIVEGRGKQTKKETILQYDTVLVLL